MSAAFFMVSDDRNRPIELTPEDVLDLKVLKDRLTRELDEVRLKTFTGDGLGGTIRCGRMNDRARELEKARDVIQRLLVRAMKGGNVR